MSSPHDSQNAGQPPRNTTPPMPDYATNPDAYRNPPELHALTLSALDAAAIDAIVESVPADDERALRAAGWVAAIQHARAAQPPIDLLDRTLAAVQQERMKLTPDAAAKDKPESFAFTRRLAEYATIAVAASVVVAVLIPGISQARQSAKRVACANNLQQLSRGFDTYATRFSGALPSLALPTEEAWDWKTVRPVAEATTTNHSNAANLIPLVRENYVRNVQLLSCPGQSTQASIAWDPSANELPDAARGYSYAVVGGPNAPRWDRRPTTIVLADRNPLFCPTGACTNAHLNSFNHGRSGNYVLRADGTVRWETSPDVGPNRDNIWTVSFQPNPARYTGTELPAAPGDVFLSP